jgi:C4-type Zn-finger protein
MAMANVRHSVFLNERELLSDCPICTESYDANHVAARIPLCGHIIGLECLVKWLHSGLDNAWKCPICRAILYEEKKQDPDAPVFMLQRLWVALSKYSCALTLYAPY